MDFGNEDAQQNINVVSSSAAGGNLRAVVTREFDTGDAADFKIDPGDVKFTMACGNGDRGNANQHNQTGGSVMGSLELAGPAPPPPPTPPAPPPPPTVPPPPTPPTTYVPPVVPQPPVPGCNDDNSPPSIQGSTCSSYKFKCLCGQSDLDTKLCSGGVCGREGCCAMANCASFAHLNPGIVCETPFDQASSIGCSTPQCDAVTCCLGGRTMLGRPDGGAASALAPAATVLVLALATVAMIV
jgi:hypothetical protein